MILKIREREHCSSDKSYGLLRTNSKADETRFSPLFFSSSHSFRFSHPETPSFTIPEMFLSNFSPKESYRGTLFEMNFARLRGAEENVSYFEGKHDARTRFRVAI